MSFSDYLENKLLEHVVGKTSYSAPSVYIGLLRSNPADGASADEPSSSNNYARVAASGANWGNASNGEIAYGATLTFNQCQTATWGNIQYVGIFDAALNGNLLASGAVSPAQTINPGQIPQFASNQLKVTLD